MWKIFASDSPVAAGGPRSIPLNPTPNGSVIHPKPRSAISSSKPADSRKIGSTSAWISGSQDVGSTCSAPSTANGRPWMSIFRKRGTAKPPNTFSRRSWRIPTTSAPRLRARWLTQLSRRNPRIAKRRCDAPALSAPNATVRQQPDRVGSSMHQTTA
jgi:hypothetical protein